MLTCYFWSISTTPAGFITTKLHLLRNERYAKQNKKVDLAPYWLESPKNRRDKFKSRRNNYNNNIYWIMKHNIGLQASFQRNLKSGTKFVMNKS